MRTTVGAVLVVAVSLAIAGIALVEDRLAATEAANTKALRARTKRVVIDFREQRATPQRVDGETELHAIRHPASRPPQSTHSQSASNAGS